LIGKFLRELIVYDSVDGQPVAQRSIGFNCHDSELRACAAVD
jgi:hypothetical protein